MVRRCQLTVNVNYTYTRFNDYISFESVLQALDNQYSLMANGNALLGVL